MKWSESGRGIALVYQWDGSRGQGSLARKVLTVENYIKWYTIYVVSPDGHVEPLPEAVRHAYEAATGDFSWGDHVPNPRFCDWIEANYPEYDWDEPSLDMIYGRWQRGR